MLVDVRARLDGFSPLPLHYSQKSGFPTFFSIETFARDDVIDRSKFPNADDEYTPAQHRIIDARLGKAVADIKHGRTYGPFNTAEEMAASIEAISKSCGRQKEKPSPFDETPLHPECPRHSEPSSCPYPQSFL
jgi:hypothetical protein